jgi:DNA repair protein RecO (recombination protein O)
VKQIVVHGIVLGRINYGEADRILTVLSDRQGKLQLLARGVRKVKSKLAGGVELFSVSSLTYIEGKGEVKTLISSRLVTHYGHIVTDLTRTQFAYEAMKTINKMVEAEAGVEYFGLLQQTLAGLNEVSFNLELLEIWFYMRLLTLTGHSPNLQTDIGGQKLSAAAGFTFSLDDMAFKVTSQGPFTTEHIKVLRLCQTMPRLQALRQVTIPPELFAPLRQLVKTILQQAIR